jgi:hypothetical protein
LSGAERSPQDVAFALSFGIAKKYSPPGHPRATDSSRKKFMNLSVQEGMFLSARRKHRGWNSLVILEIRF